MSLCDVRHIIMMIASEGAAAPVFTLAAPCVWVVSMC